MNLIKWNPWRESEIFSDRVNQICNHNFFPSAWLSDEPGLRDFRPVIDIYDNDRKIVIEAELPGMDKKDIHVDVKDGVLTLRGGRSFEDEVKEEKYHRKERAFGKFHRSFTLPEGLDHDKIEADYKDGVLKIEIPKPEEKKPKKVTIH